MQATYRHKDDDPTAPATQVEVETKAEFLESREDCTPDVEMWLYDRGHTVAHTFGTWDGKS